MTRRRPARTHQPRRRRLRGAHRSSRPRDTVMWSKRTKNYEQIRSDGNCTDRKTSAVSLTWSDGASWTADACGYASRGGEEARLHELRQSGTAFSGIPGSPRKMSDWSSFRTVLVH